MKKNLYDYSYGGRKVILRCDYNVPITDGIITDDTRIKASLKTINYLLQKDARIIIFSHLGKVKSEEDKVANSLFPVYLRLKELVNAKCYFCDDTRGEILENMVLKLNNGEILLVQNTRYEDYPEKKESSCDENLSKYWASLGDVFVNDAYGTCHRAHASNVGIAKFLPSAVGFLVEEEVNKLSNIMNEDSYPFMVLMGGKKVSDKTLVIDNLINKCDKLLIGGGMCFTFLKASGINVGNSVVDDDNLEYCKNILSKYGDKIILPVDFINQNGDNISANNISINDAGMDIGSESIKLFTSYLKQAKRVVVNGPMGVFEDEKFSKGTKAIYDTLKNNNIKTLIGGGDSAASVNLLGYDGAFYHVSTGGGATLEYLSGVELPGISIINNKNEKY